MQVNTKGAVHLKIGAVMDTVTLDVSIHTNDVIQL